VKPLKVKILAFEGGTSDEDDVIDHTGSENARPVAFIELVPPSSSWSRVCLRELRQKVERA
jgi:hypothetical protein